MLDTMIHWLSIVPLNEPWRAIFLLGAVFAFTLILHGLWEFGFKLTGQLGHSNGRSKA